MRSDGKKLSFVEWIGFRANPNYANVRWLGYFFGCVLILIGLALAFGGIATLFQFLSIIVQPGADHEAIRNVGLIVVALLGAPFVLWRALVGQKQADTAEQSHITDQINKAVSGLGAEKTVDRIGRPVTVYSGNSNTVTHLVKDAGTFRLKPKSLEVKRYDDVSYIETENGTEEFEGLHIEVKTWEDELTKIEWQNIPLELEEGSEISEISDWSVFSETLPNIEVRIGAVYALERIAQDSLRDHVQVMEILTAYIRENAPVRDLRPSNEPFMPARVRPDIQAALDVIGRRTPEQIALEHSRKHRLDLGYVDLSGANFSRGNFEGALLFGSRLEASVFRRTNLRGAKLDKCLLNFADFFDADLCGAVIDRAVINRLDGWNRSFMAAKDIRGLSMAGADVSAIIHFRKDETHSPTFGTIDTILCSHLHRQRQEREEDINQFDYLVNGDDIEDEIGVRGRLRSTGFLYWSPLNADDNSTKVSRAKFWQDIGLKGFPFFDH